MKINGKRCLKEARTRLEWGWPGGMRDGRILRFAEADTDSASAFRICSSNTAAAGAGRIQSLRAFRRAGTSEMEGRVEEGSGNFRWRGAALEHYLY